MGRESGLGGGFFGGVWGFRRIRRRKDRKVAREMKYNQVAGSMRVVYGALGMIAWEVLDELIKGRQRRLATKVKRTNKFLLG